MRVYALCFWIYITTNIHFSQNPECTPLKKDPYLYYLWILLFADTFLIYIHTHTYLSIFIQQRAKENLFYVFSSYISIFPILGCFLRKYSCFLFAFLWGGSVDFNNRNF